MRNEQLEKEAMYQLSEQIRNLLKENKIQECRNIICSAMGVYPDAAEPHNLYGILKEHQGEHQGAMKHFRAAWSLDQTYAPARKNMEQYGSFSSSHITAFNENDCQEQREGKSISGDV